MADEAKARGNALFGQKKYDEAMEAYAEGLALVRSPLTATLRCLHDMHS